MGERVVGPDPGRSTAERVREAALDLFATRGYHGTGIRQLAEHAGIGSASLYHYMGTKEELLAAIMRESLERLLAAAERTLAGLADRPPAERVAALVRLHVREHAERPRETRVVDGEVDALGPAARAEVVALRDRYEAIWQREIEAGAPAAGRSGLERRALLEMCSGVAHWYRAEGPLDVSAVADRYAVLALRLLGLDGAGSGEREPHASHE